MGIVSRSKRAIEDYLVAAVIFLVPFHAFLTVWLSSLVGGYTWVRLWPSYITVLVAAILIVPMVVSRSRSNNYRDSILVKLALVYVCLVVLLGAVAYFGSEVGLKALAYGVLINTRYLIWFVLAFLLARRSSWMSDRWRKIVFIPLIVVMLFGLLQFFVLPRDFLSNFGYQEGVTISPAITLNQDNDTLRVQSLLRGPNQFGMYMMFGIAMVIGVLTRTKQSLRAKAGWILLLIGLGLGLLLSFSRSALLGVVAVVGVYLLMVVGKQISQRLLWVFISVLMLGGLLAFGELQSNTKFQHLIFHSADDSTAEITSNDGHLHGIRTGIEDLASEPLGGGPGTAGPASAYNTEGETRLSESQYLGIGQELGWLGLGLFIILSLFVSLKLYAASQSPLAYGLFLSSIGMAVANLFMYGWFDETLSYVWWGLAGFVAARVLARDPLESIRRGFININKWLCVKFDEIFLPKHWSVHGLKDFAENIVPIRIPAKGVVYDIGGGKRPFLGSEMSKPEAVKVVGVDIDGEELKRAPAGAYDKTIVSDISSDSGVPVKIAKADAVVCEAVLEHVSDTERALANIVSITKQGGEMLLFVPGRLAVFAVVNRMLPEKIKRKLLFRIFPETSHAQGFPAYYDRCTPREFVKMLEANDCRVEQIKCYYQSSYFTFFFPLHLLWRLYQLIARLAVGKDACESFSMVAMRR